ncbi:MAG: hypothetical protein AAF439_05440, partial [Pseudomonadota bacterium]
YRSGSFGDALNTPALKSDDRFLVDVRAGYEDEKFSLFGYINNVFDESYADEILPGQITVGDPLTFGLVGQVEF